MSETPAVDSDVLRDQVCEKYRAVASEPIETYHFHTGRPLANRLGYDTAITLGGAGNYVMLIDSDGAGPKLLLQAVPDAKSSKNRMHFDIETPDIDGEATRLESLGAGRLEAGIRSEQGRTG